MKRTDALELNLLVCPQLHVLVCDVIAPRRMKQRAGVRSIYAKEISNQSSDCC